MPLLSVIIPCYQQAHFLHDAIDSVRGQDQDVEVIVVDDGSPDNTEAIARTYPDVVYVRQRRQGLAAARNAGYGASRGSFLVFLDADDRLLPGALTAGYSRLAAHAECGMAAGHFRVIGPDGSATSSPAPRISNPNHFLAMVEDYFIGPPGVMMFRRSVLERVGGFDASIEHAADYDMALRVARVSPVVIHDRVVLDYRRHGENMSGDPARMLSATMRVLRRHRSFLRRTQEGRRAYAAGVRHWQQSWGQAAAEAFATARRERRVTTAMHHFWTLLRYYPAGIRVRPGTRNRSMAPRRAR